MVEPEHEPLMPNPSWKPICLAAAITVAWALVMTGIWWVIILGMLPVIFFTFLWAFEPAFPEGH
jgi:hypothetical protein